ncbi:MAG: TonB-dependent receptor plug domain-containing protein [Gemmatimonadota bacterium]|nr:TonB-dependent receptor plug domain-containing protein [Gemmatimonadota bacterium]
MYHRVESASTRLALAALAVLFAGCASAGGTNPEDAAEPTDRVPRDPATVTADDIERAPRAPFLQGRIAGVQVIPVPGGVRVQIRGRSTINGDTEPLYILDGVPVRPNAGGTIPVVANDIASIQVLKDAISTSFYGVRGANGVIVIETKRPGVSSSGPGQG